MNTARFWRRVEKFVLILVIICICYVILCAVLTVSPRFGRIWDRFLDSVYSLVSGANNGQ